MKCMCKVVHAINSNIYHKFLKSLDSYRNKDVKRYLSGHMTLEKRRNLGWNNVTTLIHLNFDVVPMYVPSGIPVLKPCVSWIIFKI